MKIEEWSLRDVVFTDLGTNHKEGTVVKLDGSYVAVHYPPLDLLDLEKLKEVNLSSCRLLRRDELMVGHSHVYVCKSLFNTLT